MLYNSWVHYENSFKREACRWRYYLYKIFYAVLTYFLIYDKTLLMYVLVNISLQSLNRCENLYIYIYITNLNIMKMFIHIKIFLKKFNKISISLKCLFKQFYKEDKSTTTSSTSINCPHHGCPSITTINHQCHFKLSSSRYSYYFVFRS